MDAILFIVMLACLVLVVGWYVGNEMRSAKGDWGILAILSKIRDGLSEVASSYRMKPRRAKEAGQAAPPASAGTEGGEDAAPAYRASDKGRRFSDKNAPGYRSRGPSPRFGERPPARPAPNAAPPDGERE